MEKTLSDSFKFFIIMISLCISMFILYRINPYLKEFSYAAFYMVIPIVASIFVENDFDIKKCLNSKFNLIFIVYLVIVYILMAIRIEMINVLLKFMSFLPFILSLCVISFDDKKVLGKMDAKKFGKLSLVLIFLLNIRLVALFLYYNGSIDFYKLLSRNIFVLGYFVILIFELFTCVGEEYGWRYFLQGRLQKYFGKIKGILITGIIWGIYHVPLYLSSGITEENLYSLIYIVFTCISFGVFLGLSYMKTQSVYVVALLHAIYNSFSSINPTDYFSATTFSINSYFIISAILNIIIFMPFLLDKDRFSI